MDKKLLEILVDKPNLVADLPEWMLPGSAINKIRNTENTAIAEIAGRDSIAAVIRACETNAIKAIIPTIAYTGTEFGNWDVTFEKIVLLKRLLKNRNVIVFNPIVLGSPKFWWKLCGRYAMHMFKSFGFYSHCIGCHLYLHAIRIPIAKKLGCHTVIGGERELHDGKIKVNQTGVALDAYISFLEKFGIKLLLPLRHEKSGEKIEEIIGETWDEGRGQLECVLSKNYQEPDGKVQLYEDAIKRFLDEFAVRIAEDAVIGYLEKIGSFVKKLKDTTKEKKTEL
ncbi:MAG: hypothetical protein HY755_03310 [Nitrospirae bacterium]|nr:hypothetical protein [Nitrospirota bacterium]